MEFTLRVWRQKGPAEKGEFKTYRVSDISPNMSFLETLDVLNQQLVDKGEDPIAYESDCLEGICGTCSLMIQGIAHGPEKSVTACQLYMRVFQDGEMITVEPFRSRAFPVIKDCVVDRRALDRIIQAGGFVSVNTGGTPDGNAIPVPKESAEIAMDAAQCIGCGACVASCKNGSAMLFVSAKVAQFAHLPQGQPERKRRVARMVAQMDREGFGNCTNQYECEAVCPKDIPVKFISEMNRDFLLACVCGGHGDDE